MKTFSLYKVLPWVMASLVPLSLSLNAKGALKTQIIEYKQGEAVLEGYLAYDDAVSSSRPGVLVIHDWMGVGPFVKERAEALAKLGYVAFAADIYGKNVRPKNVKEATEQATLYRKNRPLLRARAQAGLDILSHQSQVNKKQLAAMGFCFGGGTALELARSGANVNGIVSFHGNLDTPNSTDAKNIKGKVLVLHGADDPYVPKEQVAAFEEEMRAAKADWELVSYGNAVHAFTEPQVGTDNSKGAAYNASADRRSWVAMQNFFKEVFAAEKK